MVDLTYSTAIELQYSYEFVRYMKNCFLERVSDFNDLVNGSLDVEKIELDFIL